MSVRSLHPTNSPHSFDFTLLIAASIDGKCRGEFRTIMSIEELKQKPLWQMTGEEFLFLQETFMKEAGISAKPEPEDNSDNYAYGIRGIASIFGCSISTANRIKSSGVIDRAIKQIGRKIIVDKRKALELLGGKY